MVFKKCQNVIQLHLVIFVSSKDVCTSTQRVYLTVHTVNGPQNVDTPENVSRIFRISAPNDAWTWFHSGRGLISHLRNIKLLRGEYTFWDGRAFVMSVLVISGTFSEKICEIPLLGHWAFGCSIIDGIKFRAVQQLTSGLRVAYWSVSTLNSRSLPDGFLT